jgi:hypothetical protein
MKDGQKNRERERRIKTKAVCCFQHPPDLPPPTSLPPLPQQPLEAQEVGGTLIGEGRLVVMAGVELVEWYQIQTHGFHVFDAIPFAPSSHYYEPSSPQQPPLLGRYEQAAVMEKIRDQQAHLQQAR